MNVSTFTSYDRERKGLIGPVNSAEELVAQISVLLDGKPTKAPKNPYRRLATHGETALMGHYLLLGRSFQEILATGDFRPQLGAAFWLRHAEGVAAGLRRMGHPVYLVIQTPASRRAAEAATSASSRDQG